MWPFVVLLLPVAFVALIYSAARWPAFGATLASGIATVFGTAARAVRLSAAEVAGEVSAAAGTAAAVVVSPFSAPLAAIGERVGAVAHADERGVLEDGDFYGLVNFAQARALERSDWGSWFFLQQRGIAGDERAVRSWLSNLGYRFRSEVEAEEETERKRREEEERAERARQDDAAFGGGTFR